MPKFIVEVREVWVQPVEIEAETEEEAIKRVADAEGDWDGQAEYSHTLDPETWTIHKKEV